MAGRARVAVFIEGTKNPIRPSRTQVGHFYERCAFADVRPGADVPAGCRDVKVGYDGCGNAFGLRGTLFGHGLDEQAADVARIVEQIPGEVDVMCMGMSRGAIGCLLVAKQPALQAGRVRVALLLLDPVPGDYLWVAGADIAKTTLTNRVVDCRACNVSSVIALYPFQPLPDILVHAPLVATFSDTCTVVEDVTMGCHEGAVWLVPQRPECRAMYVRIEEGLEQFGVKLSGRPDMWKCANLRQVLQDYQVALGDGGRKTERECHALAPTKIVYKGHGEFLNSHHLNLSCKPVPGKTYKLALEIIRSKR